MGLTPILEKKAIFHYRRKLPARSVLCNVFISNVNKRINGDVTATSDNTEFFRRIKIKQMLKFYKRTS